MNQQSPDHSTAPGTCGCLFVGLSQIFEKVKATPLSAAFLCFVNLLKSEEVRKQIVLNVDGPAAREAEALPEPEHGFEAGDCAARRFERLEAADLWHVLLHTEVGALDALLQMLGDIVHRIGMQQSVVNRCLDRGWERIGTIRADLFRREQGLILEHFAEEALCGIKIAPCSQQKIDRISVLVDRPVQITPFATDIDVSLVDPN